MRPSLGKFSVELFADLHHLFAAEAAASREVGDRLEVVVLTTRQAPVEHAPGRLADVLEAVNHIARDEDDGAGTGRRGLAPDGQLVGAFENEEHFLLAEVKVVRRTFPGLVPRHEDRDDAGGDRKSTRL